MDPDSREKNEEDRPDFFSILNFNVCGYLFSQLSKYSPTSSIIPKTEYLELPFHFLV